MHCDFGMVQNLWTATRSKKKIKSNVFELKGSRADEKLIGNRQDNVLSGGAGSDILDGGAGDDRLTGGPGADFFVISEGRDQITDFNPSEGDQIVHRSNDEILRFPVDGGTLITTMGRSIDTSVAGIQPNEVSLHSQQRLKPSVKAVFPNGRSVRLESAQSDFQQSLGMMQREALSARRGMIFPLSKPMKKSVYMFNCLAPLDLVFVRRSKIVDLISEAPICTSDDPAQCPLFESSRPFDHWIELKAGSIERLGLGVGAPIDLVPL